MILKTRIIDQRGHNVKYSQYHHSIKMLPRRQFLCHLQAEKCMLNITSQPLLKHFTEHGIITSAKTIIQYI